MTNFSRFEQAKQSMLNNLYLSKQFTEQHGLEKLTKEFSTIHQTLQREQFEVMVVGEFSNGKSTFINALMRNIVLPSSNLPTTAFINKIYYAEEPKFEVCFTNNKKQELNREEFLAYVSEDKQKFDQLKEALVQKLNPLAKQATHLQIGYPTTICQNNIVIIDSPGTNDMDERRVQITDEYIPKSDAAIFVLNAKKIFSASERAFLQRIMDADIQKIFFVINFKDAIKTDEEFKEIEQIVLDHLPAALMQKKIHFVSALHALQHYVPPTKSNNPRAQRLQAARLPLEQTGLPELETALFTFLTEDSGRAKLEKPYMRAQKLLREVLDEHFAFEIQTLSKSVTNIEQHVAEIKQKLLVAEKSIKTDAQEFHRQVERESKEIIIWYKQQVAHISSEAKNCLQEGLAANTAPEELKTAIDFATGPLEKRLKQTLKTKTDAMINKLFSDRAAQMTHDISTLSTNILNQSDIKPNWGDKISAPASSENTKTDMAVGGAILGGALLFFTGGLFGWGLLGAGVGATGAYMLSKNNTNAVDELKKQVRNRYEKGLASQAQQVEKDFEKLATQLRDFYAQYSQDLIHTERKRAEQLLANQNMSASEQQQKIEAIKKQQVVGETLIFQFNKTFNDYCQKEELNLYV